MRDNMKKNITLGLALVVSLVAVAGAVQSRRTPNANDGQPIRDALYGGSDGVYHSGTSAQMVCTGKCLLLGVTRQTGQSTFNFLLRNTIAADNIYVANLVPIIHFQPDTGAHDNPIAFPLVFSAGIAVDASDAGAGLTVHYLDLDE
jgi:hypothetical protein